MSLHPGIHNNKNLFAQHTHKHTPVTHVQQHNPLKSRRPGADGNNFQIETSRDMTWRRERRFATRLLLAAFLCVARQIRSWGRPWDSYGKKESGMIKTKALRKGVGFPIKQIHPTVQLEKYTAPIQIPTWYHWGKIRVFVGLVTSAFLPNQLFY